MKILCTLINCTCVVEYKIMDDDESLSGYIMVSWLNSHYIFYTTKIKWHIKNAVFVYLNICIFEIPWTV